MSQADPLDGAMGYPAHVMIRRNVIEMVESEDAAGQRLQEPHPVRFALIFPAILLDGKGNVLGTEFFPRGERPAGATPQLSNDFAEMLLNNRLSEIFVGEIVTEEKVVVEKMAEGANSDIVDQSGNTHVLINDRCRWTLVAQDFETRCLEA